MTRITRVFLTRGLAALAMTSMLVTAGCGEDPVDPCEGEECAPPEATCEGDVAVEFTGFGVCTDTGECDYANVRAETDCAALGQFCENGACVEADPCEGVDCSTPPNDFCDGDTLVTYTGGGTCANGNCDFSAAEQRTDCTASGQVCDVDQCVTPDPCDGVTCEAPAAFCEGDTAVSYTGAGTCDSSDGSCDYSAVEERTDCTAASQVCQNGACVEPGGLCDGVTCDAPAASCDGDTAVTYTGAGTCDSTDGSCDYSSVEVRTDCTASSQVCQNGACVTGGGARAPEAGELVVTEIMQNPNAVSDGDGEWFEVVNVTSDILELDGVAFTDDGANAFTVTGSTQVQPGAFFVFGNNADQSVNGGVVVDYAYTGFSLGNGSDEIIITNAAGTEVDRVAWDGGTLWPDPTGASMQLDGALDPAAVDNNDAANWCETTVSTYGAGDFGTPGAANDECPVLPPPAAYTIYELQDETNANHPVVGAPVIVGNVNVTFAGNDGRGNPIMWIEDPQAGQFSGIAVDPAGIDISTINRGDVVTVEGAYEEDVGRSVISATAITFVSAGTAPDAELVSTFDLSPNGNPEAWEGVLIQVIEAGVTNENADAPGNDFGEYRIDNNIRVNDLLYALPTPETNCDLFASITGILDFTFGNFKIEPRDAADYGAITVNTVGTAPAAVTVTSTAFTPATVCLPAGGGDVNWSNTDSVDLTIQSREPSTGAVTAAPIDVTVTAGGAATSSLTTAGTYHYLLQSAQGVQGRTIVLE